MAGFQPSITIKQTVDRISNNEYLLPAFQREYVWSHEQVENLFDSVMKGYPISSMLFWKVSGEAKNSYKFYKVIDHFVEQHHIHDSAFNTNQVNDFHAVLDGQQRLTSLYLGLCGSYAYHKRYARWDNSENNFPTRLLYLNISRTLVNDENDKEYEFSFKEQDVTGGKDLYTDNNGMHWFRVGNILTVGDGNSSYKIRHLVRDYNLNDDEFDMLEKLQAQIFNNNCISYYEVESTIPDEAVKIFVRINSGGTTLSFSDILLSMMIAGWKKDARKEIYQLVDLVNNKGFNINHDYVLKAFLYLYRNDVRFKIKSFNNDFISLMEQKWEGIRDSIDELFELLRGFGLDRSSLTSNYATLPLLYYIYHRDIYKGFANLTGFANERENMRVWLMKSLIQRTFGRSSDSVLQASHKAFTEDVPSCPMSADVTLFPADKLSVAIRQEKELSDEYIDNLLTIHKDNGYAFAVLSLLYRHLDYRNTFHKDHLHPFILCKEAELDYNVYDTILNLQMLDANENMSKNDKPLKQWVDEQTADADRAAFLKSHLIPDVSLELEDFNNFIAQRHELLKDKIRQIFIIKK